MEDTALNQSVIIITGMHRSGTSLTASLLQSAGINIGDRLMGANTGNEKGHFEDMDFVEFHQNALQSQEINIAGWTNNSQIQVQQQYLADAQKLILARQNHPIWGWKDPRTTLFLDFWSQLIPHSKYIFTYRSPWEVVDSLFRRGDVIFNTNPNFAIEQWCNYNQTILDFYQRYQERCLLLEISNVIHNPEEMIALIKQKFSLELRSPESLFESSLYQIEQDIAYRQTIIAKFFPQAVDLYHQLQNQADLTTVNLEQSSIESLEENYQNYQPCILQDWNNSKRASIQLRQIKEQLIQSEKQLKIAQRQTERFKSLVVAMESSKFWKLRKWWLNLRQKFNRPAMDTIYQNYQLSVGKVSSPANPFSLPKGDENIFSDQSEYQRWLNINYPQPNELKKIAAAIRKVSYQPLISIIVPVYNPPENFLREAIESVLEQAYGNWELCLADDCSTKPYVKTLLEEYAQKDRRIKVTFRPENGHICHTSNSALELATGEYIALLDHDDLLAPHALAEVVKLLNKHPEADYIYSDEDKVDEYNIHRDPFFKPDWCPDSFLARMYTCHLGVFRRSLIREIEGFRPGFEGSQDYDLVLRVTEKTDHIFHIPTILYHWRIHSESAAGDVDAKPYAFAAAKKAINEAIYRRGEPGKVTNPLPGVYRVRYQIKEPKLVSIIIPTKDLADTLNVCLKSIFTKTTYDNYEVIVIDNGSKEAKTARCFSSWQQKEPKRFKCYPYDVPFNYSQINNYAVRQAKGDYLLFLNNDTEIITNDWLEAMVEQAQRPSIGAVGGLLLYPDETIQHAGVVLGIGGVANHSHKNFEAADVGYFAQIVSTNNYSAVTAACLMCRREVFEEVGGFEEQLAIAFNDIDFCLKIVSRGYRNIYLPHVVLYHYESKSRGQENTSAKQARFNGEVNYMREKWHQICDQDPCYNPNLTKNHEDYSLNI